MKTLDETRRQTMGDHDMSTHRSNWSEVIACVGVFLVCTVGLNGIILYELRHIRDEVPWTLVSFFTLIGLIALTHAWVGRRDDPPATQDPEVRARILWLRGRQKALRKIALGSGVLAASLSKGFGGELLQTPLAALASAVGLLVCSYYLVAALRLGRNALDLSHGVAGLVLAPFLFAFLPVLWLMY